MGSYRMSVGALAQRRAACVSRRRVYMVNGVGKRVTGRNPGKTGAGGLRGDVVGVKDVGRLRALDDFARGDEELECLYKRSVCDVLANPLLVLAKEIGEVDVRKARFERDNPGCVLDPLLLKALDLKVKAVQVYVKGLRYLRDGKRGRFVGKGGSSGDEGLVVDADFNVPEEE